MKVLTPFLYPDFLVIVDLPLGGAVKIDVFRSRQLGSLLREKNRAGFENLLITLNPFLYTNSAAAEVNFEPSPRPQ